MECGQIKIVGIISIVKDGNKSFVIHGFTPFEDWEVERGCHGYKAVSEYTRADCSKLKLDQIIEPIYTKGFKGQATMSSYRTIAEK